jgi:Protein of unknown function (DUF1236)
MKTRFLTTVCAAALAASLGLGVAYAEPADHQGGGAMGASQAGGGNGPSGQSATPGGAAAMTDGGGGGAPDNKGDNNMGDNAPMKSSKPGDKAANAKDRGGDKSAESDMSGEQADGDRNRQRAADHDQMGDEKSAERHDRNADDNARHDRDNKTAESKDRNDHKNGKRAEFDSHDKQKVKRYFTEHKPRAKRIDRDRIHVSIGVAIPGSIALYPLPSGIVVAAGGCPVQYFLWGDDLVVVDSCSREVVDIVPGVG